MKRELLKILCCPVCKSHLRLDIADEERGEIMKGTLYCASCNVYYPIDEGIPNLLPADVR